MPLPKLLPPGLSSYPSQQGALHKVRLGTWSVGRDNEALESGDLVLDKTVNG